MRVNELMDEQMRHSPLYLYSFTVTNVINVIDMSGGPILDGFPWCNVFHLMRYTYMKAVTH